MRLNWKVYSKWCARPKERMGLRICVLFVILVELGRRILLSVLESSQSDTSSTSKYHVILLCQSPSRTQDLR